MAGGRQRWIASGGSMAKAFRFFRCISASSRGRGPFARFPPGSRTCSPRSREDADELARDQRMSLRSDIEALSKSSTSFASDLGRGVAIFKSSGAGIDEHIGLPGPVRDRAVVDVYPYLRPLEAMLDHYRRFCVAVVDARFASIFRFRMDRLESWEEMRSSAIGEEDFRKANYGGFSGLRRAQGAARTPTSCW